MLGLPKWSATPAIHIISGQLPIEYQLDMKILTFIHSLININPTRDILLRQFVMRSSSSNSLVTKFKEKLHEYHLPTIYDLFINTPDKLQWKREVKNSIIQKASKSIAEATSNMSTLKYLSKDFLYNEPHPAVLYVKNSRQVSRACVKIMVLTGTYPLQCARHRMKKTETTLCPLCKTSQEDTQHFVEHCHELDEVRLRYTDRIRAVIPHPLNTTLTQALLDSRLLQTIHPKLKQIEDLEQTSRDFIFALHLKRTSLLNSTFLNGIHINCKKPVTLLAKL
jgi:hypothetical protein